tara:strand:+ start:439 stop:579 length:141 start_codon:yes stop_codon:yes gene_type:complete
MKELLKPTNIKDPKKGEEYTLEDKDYLLIRAIQDLTDQIRRLASKS